MKAALEELRALCDQMVRGPWGSPERGCVADVEYTTQFAAIDDAAPWATADEMLDYVLRITPQRMKRLLDLAARGKGGDEYAELAASASRPVPDWRWDDGAVEVQDALTQAPLLTTYSHDPEGLMEDEVGAYFAAFDPGTVLELIRMAGLETAHDVLFERLLVGYGATLEQAGALRDEIHATTEASMTPWARWVAYLDQVCPGDGPVWEGRHYGATRHDCATCDAGRSAWRSKVDAWICSDCHGGKLWQYELDRRWPHGCSASAEDDRGLERVDPASNARALYWRSRRYEGWWP